MDASPSASSNSLEIHRALLLSHPPRSFLSKIHNMGIQQLYKKCLVPAEAGAIAGTNEVRSFSATPLPPLPLFFETRS